MLSNLSNKNTSSNWGKWPIF